MTRCSVTSGWQPSYSWLRTAATNGSRVDRMPPGYTAAGLEKMTFVASTRPRVAAGVAERAGRLGGGVGGEPYDVLGRGHVTAAFPQDADQGGPGGDGLQAAGVAAGAGRVVGRSEERRVG